MVELRIKTDNRGTADRAGPGYKRHFSSEMSGALAFDL